MDRVIPFAAENDITVVIATGNEAPDPLSNTTPQNRGTRDNELITVGSVEVDGTLNTDTSPDLGDGGSITLYAAGRNVKVATTADDSSFGTASGSSVAAPAVAGMAVYFFSIPALDALWPNGRVARALKEFFVISASVQRNKNPVPDNLGYEEPRPESIVVAWNRHPVGFEGCGAGSVKVKRQDSSLPDVSCPDPADDPGSGEGEAPPTTTQGAATSTDPACTYFYNDGSSSCINTSNDCPPASSLVCPLGLKKRGAHIATEYTTYHATESFVTAVPTNVGFETAWNGL